MSKYKNVFLMVVAIILLGYAAFISIIPSMMSKNFNIDKFEQATLKAAGLNVTFEIIDIKIKPNLKTIIVVRDLVAMYPDQQPLFTAKYIELETTPAAIFKKDFDIKSLYLKHVKYEDLILPEGVNKLAYFPEAFDPSYYGTKKITIRPNSHIRIKNLETIKTISKPYSFKKSSEREVIYSQADVSTFLHSLNFKNVNIR